MSIEKQKILTKSSGKKKLMGQTSIILPSIYFLTPLKHISHTNEKPKIKSQNKMLFAKAQKLRAKK